jgi:arginine N-succinyltransferase
MILVRTVRETDINGILSLAQQAYPGMTTLPPEQDVLEAKISNSINSASKSIDSLEGESYFLVMEDTETNEVVGTSAIIANLGFNEPFYSYKLNRVTQTCKELDKKVSFETLNLSNHFEGFAEVATLYLHKDYRKNGNGKLLARSRYLFMAQFRDRFPESVMADLRGYFDDQGRSPFWDAVGSHFFDMRFADADLYGGIHGNQFIADLMPKQPLYVNMLPKAAQEVIGQPNVVGKPALEMLKNEGFRWNGHVDIFDAAPSVDTKIDEVVSVKNSHLAEIIGLSEADEDDYAMVSNSDVNSFKTVYCKVSIEKGGVRIPRATLKALELNLGDSIRYLLV